MRAKHVPIRTCVGCGEKKPKGEMLRIVRTVDGGISLDVSGKKSGRGVYVCFNSDCVGKALKKKAIQRSLKINELDRSIIEEVERLIAKRRDGLEDPSGLCPKG
ncbi:MAG: YlxR family protein [Synergistetes bacterium]|nr:YlxR family protein [Synergistota bacterium]MCX8128192.1 YlxR family protein [Synergistota bacterium]MDW8192568.1 YlxR family protein [Synergistota bacterium]